MTVIAFKALEALGGPGVILKAVPGGIERVAREARVCKSRVSQVLRKDPLPREWASLLAELIGCREWDVYHQLGQKSPTSPYGPLFDSVESSSGNGQPQIKA